MATTVYSESQRAHADLLLSRSHTWPRATRKSDGLAFIIFPSSRTGKAYYTREGACTCIGFLHRGQCSHELAVRLEAEQAREAAARKPRYEDLFPEDEYGTVSAF